MMRRALLALLALVIGVSPAKALAGDSSTTEQGEAQTEVDTSLPMGPLLLGSFGLVVIAVGAGFGWQAYQENSDFNEKAVPAEQGGNPVYPNATNDLADDIAAHAITADVLMFSGVAIAASSVIWWLLIGDKNEVEVKGHLDVKEAKWRPLIGPRQAGLQIIF